MRENEGKEERVHNKDVCTLTLPSYYKVKKKNRDYSRKRELDQISVPRVHACAGNFPPSCVSRA